ncbi:MAG: SDR family oxidoreductase [bacterium]|nr:SDR family oxidoreductase [bacterium]
MQPRRIVITGCSSGFGRLMAEDFARAGWLVLATTRSPESLPQLENLHVLATDIADGHGRKAVADYVRDHWNDALDCLVNNAGFAVNGAFETLSDAQVKRQFEVNVFAAMSLTRELLPALRQARGRIINFSSVLGFTGMPLASIYAASKFALEGWSESLYYELQPQGVQVALVEPGGFRTKFGQNIEWGDANGSAYTAQIGSFRNFFERRTQGTGNDPAKVSKCVIELASAKHMPLRTRIGADSHGLYFLRRLTPQRMADMILRAVGRRLQGG